MTPDERSLILDWMRGRAQAGSPDGVLAYGALERLSSYAEQLEARLRRVERLVSVWSTEAAVSCDPADMTGVHAQQLEEALSEREQQP